MSYISEACLISLLWVLHTSFSLYLYIRLYTAALVRVLKNILGRGRSEDSLAALRAQLNKVPKHIAFIVLESSIDYDALAKLVIWSIVMGTDTVSLYDLKGRIKQNQDKLLLSINRKFKERGGCEACTLIWRSHADSLAGGSERTVIVTKNGAMYPDVNGNGRIEIKGHHPANNMEEVNGGGRSVNISLLSGEDGKKDIARCARELVGWEQPVTEELVSTRLRTNKHLADPALVIRLGILNSNLEFPPWQLRLSEIHSIESTLALSLHQFTDVLQKYSRCEQRFGK